MLSEAANAVPSNKPACNISSVRLMHFLHGPHFKGSFMSWFGHSQSLGFSQRDNASQWVFFFPRQILNGKVIMAQDFYPPSDYAAWFFQLEKPHQMLMVSSH